MFTAFVYLGPQRTCRQKRTFWKLHTRKAMSNDELSVSPRGQQTRMITEDLRIKKRTLQNLHTRKAMSNDELDVPPRGQ